MQKRGIEIADCLGDWIDCIIKNIIILFLIIVFF